MLLGTQIALACDGLEIHTRLLDAAIEAKGFASLDSYSTIELEGAERRLRKLADKIGEQRKRLAGNEPKPDAGSMYELVRHLEAAE